jgi:hypothetical protein
MAAAVAVGGGMLLVNQAAISALLVVTLQPEQGAFDLSRLLDAAVGAAVAFGINAVMPHRPERLLASAARPLYEELSSTLTAIADGLQRPGLIDPGAVERGRELDARARALREAVEAVSQMQALPRRGPPSTGAGAVTLAAARAELAVSDVHVLARGTANAVRHGNQVPEPLLAALRELAGAAGRLAELLGEERGSDWRRLEDVRGQALEAARLAMSAIEHRPTLAVTMLAGQVRMTAVDLLVSSGLEHGAAVLRLEEAAGVAARLRVAGDDPRSSSSRDGE